MGTYMLLFHSWRNLDCISCELVHLSKERWSWKNKRRTISLEHTAILEHAFLVSLWQERNLSIEGPVEKILKCERFKKIKLFIYLHEKKAKKVSFIFNKILISSNHECNMLLGKFKCNLKGYWSVCDYIDSFEYTLLKALLIWPWKISFSKL